MFAAAAPRFQRVGIVPLSEFTLFQIVRSGGIVSTTILIVLLGFSLISWAVIFQKFGRFRRSVSENTRFLALYWKVADLIELRKAAMRMKQSPVARVFLAGLERLDPDFSLKTEDDLKGMEEAERTATIKILERTLRRAIDEQVEELEAYLAFLATTGNVSPFIGLFGTVLGIINAFHGISRQGTASIAAVAPGIAEALIATAAGLLAAIPAVVAFNHYNSRVRRMASEMESFSTEFLSLVEERVVQPGSPGKVSPA